MHLINHSLKKSAAIAAAGALMFSLFVSGGMVMAAPPPVPVITTESQSTSTNPIILTGTTVANGTVIIIGFSGNQETTADASGNWSASVALEPNEPNEISVVAVNAGGELSSADTVTITHDTSATGGGDVTAPAAPVVLFPVSPASTTTSPIVLVGTAEAGSAIRITGGTGTVNATTTAGGTWSATVALNASSTNTLVVTATDAAGNVSGATTLSVTHSAATTSDVTAPNAPVVTFPISPYTTTANAVVVTGTAEAGSTVSLMGGGTSGTTTTSVAGIWSILVPLTSGTTTNFTLTATDAAGNVSSSTMLVITQTASGGTGTTTATTSPQITLIGDASDTVFICNIGSSGYIDPGVRAVNGSGSSTPVSVSGFVNASSTGTYILTYTATDGGLTATSTRTVTVIGCSSGSGGGGSSSSSGGSSGSTNTSNSSGNTGTTEVLGVSFIPFYGATPTVNGTNGTTQVLGASYVPGMPTTGAGGDAFKSFILPILISLGLVAVGLSLGRREKISLF